MLWLAANHVRELCLPLGPWKILRMSVPTPESLKDHLIFCLITSCARLNNRRCCHWAVVFTDVIGERPVVHEPEVVPLHHHGLQHDAAGANGRGGPHHAEGHGGGEERLL